MCYITFTCITLRVRNFFCCVFFFLNQLELQTKRSQRAASRIPPAVMVLLQLSRRNGETLVRQNETALQSTNKKQVLR